MNQLITKEMTIEQILSNFPQKSQKIAQEITNSGLNCVGCGAATWETLEAGMLSHGFAQDKIEQLLNRLNTILAEKSDLTTISMTPKAVKKFQEICIDEGKAGWGLRFGDRAAGCSGFEYVLDYCEKASSDDETFESNGLSIYVNKKVVGRLLGSVIDYVDGLNGAGFKISNPQAKGSCGCGKSQNY